MPVAVYVMTSEKYLWAIEPFAYLFNIFWSELQPITVVTDVKPDFMLPENFTVRSMNYGQPLSKHSWSNGLIVMMENIDDSNFVLLLEDYWLCRTVDHQAIETLADWARGKPDVLRVDLTDDRQYAGDMRDIGYLGRLDMVETPPDSPYQFSLQAAIWNRELLLELVRPDLSPWEAELFLSPTLHEIGDRMRAVGTRQRPIRYINAFKGGDPEDVLNLEGIPDEHVVEMRRRGWLKE